MNLSCTFDLATILLRAGSWKLKIERDLVVSCVCVVATVTSHIKLKLKASQKDANELLPLPPASA